MRRIRGVSGLLSLSIIALFLGPLFYHWLSRGGLIARTLDAAIVVVLVLLVVFMLLPESISVLGWWAIALILTGYLAPLVLESLVRKAAHTLHFIALILALLGLALHSVLDGAGLAGSSGHATSGLATAIVLHRFGVGLILWMIVEPAFGRRWALAVLIMISALTVLGYLLPGQWLGMEDSDYFQIIQALIIGTIIHSLVHRSHAHSH